MYFLNHRSEDSETLYMGADKHTLRSYVRFVSLFCIPTLSGSLPTFLKTDFKPSDGPKS